jgi:hypothetical protein
MTYNLIMHAELHRQYIAHILAGKPKIRIYYNAEQSELIQRICMSTLVFLLVSCICQCKTIKQKVIKCLIPV